MLKLQCKETFVPIDVGRYVQEKYLLLFMFFFRNRCPFSLPFIQKSIKMKLQNIPYFAEPHEWIFSKASLFILILIHTHWTK
jgi:hypothetical protein